MGDRANVFIKQAGVYLYGHWIGYGLSLVVREALKRAADKARSGNCSRWDDPPYLARIVFAEMTKGSEHDNTGFGISTTRPDNERAVIVLDCATQTVSRTRDGYRKADPSTTVDEMSMSRFIEMTDEQCREWHHKDHDNG